MTDYGKHQGQWLEWHPWGLKQDLSPPFLNSKQENDETTNAGSFLSGILLIDNFGETALDLCCSLRHCVSIFPSPLLSVVSDLLCGLKALLALIVFLLTSLFLSIAQAFFSIMLILQIPSWGLLLEGLKTTHLPLLPFTAPLNRVLRRRPWFLPVLILVPHSNTETISLKTMTS